MSRKIIWTEEAVFMLQKTLEYWNNRNKTFIYSNKIISEVEAIEIKILENPYFLAKFNGNVNLYQRIFFKGKFSLFYDIKEDSIVIIHFRSNQQKPF